MSAEQHGRYDALMRPSSHRPGHSRAKAQAASRGGWTSDGDDAIISERPRTRSPVGHDAAIGVRLAQFVSDRMLDRMLAHALKPYFAKARQHRQRRPRFGLGLKISGPVFECYRNADSGRHLPTGDRGIWRSEFERSLATDSENRSMPDDLSRMLDHGKLAGTGKE